MEKVEDYKETFGEKARRKWNAFSMDMQVWWRDNHEWAIVVIPAGCAVAVKLINTGSKMISQASQLHAARINQATMWDPSMQMHHVLKHPMTQLETNDYERLRSQGFSMSETLNMMNLKR